MKNAPLVSDRSEALARRLAAAQEKHALLPTLEADEAPADAQQAYDIQHRVLDLRGLTLAAWKVGAKSPDGPIQGAPLPSTGVLTSPASLQLSRFATCGLELEIAFRFGRVFAARAPSDRAEQTYSETEVLAGIASMMATIEIVSTRHADWPAVDKFAQLADMQNHGALAISEPVAFNADFPFMAPALSFQWNGLDIVKGPPANPAGDPRRLLTWLVNHATNRGIAITTETIVTTGSYTGMHFVKQPGLAIGRIEGLPAVQLTLT